MSIGGVPLAGTCLLVAVVFFALASVMRPSWASTSTADKAHWTKISFYACLMSVFFGLLGFVLSDVSVAGLVYASTAFLWVASALSDLKWHKVSTPLTFVVLGIMSVLMALSKTIGAEDLKRIFPIAFACIVGWCIASLVIHADGTLWLAYIVSSYCILVISHHPYVENAMQRMWHHVPVASAGTAMAVSLLAVMGSLVVGSYIAYKHRNGKFAGVKTIKNKVVSARSDAPYSLPYQIGMMKTAQAPSLAVGVLVVMVLS